MSYTHYIATEITRCSKIQVKFLSKMFVIGYVHTIVVLFYYFYFYYYTTDLNIISANYQTFPFLHLWFFPRHHSIRLTKESLPPVYWRNLSIRLLYFLTTFSKWFSSKRFQNKVSILNMHATEIPFLSHWSRRCPRPFID